MIEKKEHTDKHQTERDQNDPEIEASERPREEQQTPEHEGDGISSSGVAIVMVMAI